MNIEIDYNPSPKDFLFISVALNDKEAISFDYTYKGHRVIKQALVDNKPFPKDKKPTSEWDAIVLENGRFVKKYHVRWFDMDKKDQVNDEIWETVAEQPITAEVKDKLLHYSHLVSYNYDNLDSYSKEIKEFESLLRVEIDKFVKNLA